MLKSLKKSWKELSKDRPGHRFQNRHKRQEGKGSRTARFLKLGFGILLVAVGVVFLLIPGPGSVGIVIGGALLAEESLVVARFLDNTELRIRKWIEAARSRWAKHQTRH